LRKRSLVVLLVVMAAVAVPAACSFAILLPGLVDVLRTGMCPAAPPDFPPGPCTPWEYLLRATISPWAIIGNMGIAIGWWAVLALGAGAVYFSRGFRWFKE
jgi:hypothetical protein